MDESHDDFEPRETSYICGRVLHNQVEKPENTMTFSLMIHQKTRYLNIQFIKKSVKSSMYNVRLNYYKLIEAEEEVCTWN